MKTSLLLLLIWLIIPNCVNAGVAPTYLGSWGGFQGGWAIATDASGFVYVVDGEWVRKFTSDGALLSSFDANYAPSQCHVSGITVDGSGNIFLAFPGGVMKFSGSGEYIGSWGGQGVMPGQLWDPVGIEVDANGLVYTIENVTGCHSEASGEMRIQRFANDGTYISGFPANGFDIGIAPDATIYVAAYSQSQVQHYTSSGALVAQWGSLGRGPGQFNDIARLCVDNAGSVYTLENRGSVTESEGRYRIQKFSSAGEWQCEFGEPGTGPGQFVFPRDVATDGFGNVFVLDSGASRVHRFGFGPVPAEGVSWGKLKAYYR